MTENQEKQLFKTLETLVTGVNKIQSDVTEVKETLNKHSDILSKHSDILSKHSDILKRLEAKTDAIAEKVMSHEIRFTKVEKKIEDLEGGIH
ncbi:MAG: hypothetical protein JSS81_03360 [Acidobacteria bacterium]|nr:hypothetical protein [Acidobacteriota bacterium]